MALGDILLEAKRLINGKRQEDYGDPAKNIQDIADFWTIYLETKITGRDVCNLMSLVKLAREIKKQTRDNALDICGYQAISADLFGGQK